MNRNTGYRRIDDQTMDANTTRRSAYHMGRRTRLFGAALATASLVAIPALGQAHAATPLGVTATLRSFASTRSAASLAVESGTVTQTSLITATLASTVPSIGDVNPYGVAVIPRSMGKLAAGSVLVSNFNSKDHAGMGTTIVQINPSAKTQSVFAQLDPRQLTGCPGVGQGSGVGLTTALTVLRRGYVVVGSLPTSDGSPVTAKAGCLIVLDTNGHVVRTISTPDINGPWDMTAYDQGNQATLFVTNVLNGTVAAYDKTAKAGKVVNRGTVVRLTISLPQPGQGTPHVLSDMTIASGFAEQADPNALVLGPTGVGLGKDGTLYVADTVENRIAAIPNALTRMTDAYTGRDLTAGGDLNAPLGLTMTPNGDILTANGGDGKLVRTTPDGNQVKSVLVDGIGKPAGAGNLFSLAISNGGHTIYFGNDGANSLNRVALSQTAP